MTEANTSPIGEQWNPEPGESLPWWLTEQLTGEQGTLLVRCLAVVAAFLGDELRLAPGALPGLLRAAVLDYGRVEGPIGLELGMQSLFVAVRVAFG